VLENNDRLLYVWYISMEEYDNIKWPEDITHVQERPDGSSDGLPEAMDIDLGDGYKECSNWNPDITQKWDLEDLFRETTEPTAEQLVEVFNKAKEELFPGKSELTPKEEAEVYKMISKKWENK
jgi:hypothetical protein